MDVVLLFWHRSENQVPQRGADTVTLVGCFEMMLHVIAFQEFRIARVHGQVMGSIVNHVVDQVPENGASEQWVHPLWNIKQSGYYQNIQPVKYESQGDTDCGRHNQAGFTLWLSMVYPVKQENNSFKKLSTRGKMKNKTMQRIFHESPQEHAQQEATWDVYGEAITT